MRSVICPKSECYFVHRKPLPKLIVVRFRPFELIPNLPRRPPMLLETPDLLIVSRSGPAFKVFLPNTPMVPSPLSVRPLSKTDGTPAR